MPELPQSQVLASAAKEGRDIEGAITKVLVTVALGALALSAGYLLGDKARPFPQPLRWALIASWLLLFGTAFCGLSNWVLVSVLMNRHALEVREYLEGGRRGLTQWRRLERFSECLVIAMAFSCLAGLGLLCYVAIKWVTWP